MNFQDISIRSALQLLADYTHVNLLVSDSVQGQVSIHLEDVPWEQAMAHLLSLKGLGRRQEGNVLQIAPLAELQRLDQVSLDPLQIEVIPVHYTRAESIREVLYSSSQTSTQNQIRHTTTHDGALLLKDAEQTSSRQTQAAQSLLSARGHVSADIRTNQLIVQDTRLQLQRIRELVAQLDRPVRQVLVEARIVIASLDFSEELGAKMALKPRKQPPQPTFASLGADLLTHTPYGSAQYVIAMGDYLLDMELSAAEKQGRGEVISHPRLLTTDQSRALIRQGLQIPYQVTQQGTGGGNPVQNIAFKDAVLELNVTPHITPDDHILMDLAIKKDSAGLPLTIGGQPPIEKREIDTVVQVHHGDTVVLGGVYEIVQRQVIDEVPLLGDLPLIGFLFRSQRVEDDKKELLVFVTPKILDRAMAVAP
ncbi:MAG: type pilus secretin PilQ [Pseudomonadota bacterium]